MGNNSTQEGGSCWGYSFRQEHECQYILVSASRLRKYTSTAELELETFKGPLFF